MIHSIFMKTNNQTVHTGFLILHWSSWNLGFFYDEPQPYFIPASYLMKEYKSKFSLETQFRKRHIIQLKTTNFMSNLGTALLYVNAWLTN